LTPLGSSSDFPSADPDATPIQISKNSKLYRLASSYWWR